MALKEVAAGTERQEEGLLPQSIRSMDYWRATELFHLFDRRTGPGAAGAAFSAFGTLGPSFRGELDKLGFYHLLTAASRDRESIARRRSDARANRRGRSGLESFRPKPRNPHPPSPTALAAGS